MRRILPTVCILTLVHFCSSAMAENVTMNIKSQQAKVYQGKTVIATVKQFQEVTQTAKKGKWVGIQWEAADGKIKRGWVSEDHVEPVGAGGGEAAAAQIPGGAVPVQPVGAGGAAAAAAAAQVPGGAMPGGAMPGGAMPGGAMPQGGGVPGGNQFDKDGDGKLSPAEMQAAMKSGAGGVPGGAAAMPGGAMPLGGGAKPGARKSKLRPTPRGSMLSRDAADGGNYGFDMMAFDKDKDGKLNAVENKAAMEGMKKMMRTGGKIGDVVGGAMPPGENMPEGVNMPAGGNMPAGEKMPVGGNMPRGAKMPGGPGGAKTKPKPRDIGPGGFEYRYIWKFDKNKDGQLTGQEKQKAELFRKKLLDKEMKKMMKQNAPR